MDRNNTIDVLERYAKYYNYTNLIALLSSMKTNETEIFDSKEVIQIIQLVKKEFLKSINDKQSECEKNRDKKYPGKKYFSKLKKIPK